jgi:hypothetical protein
MEQPIIKKVFVLEMENRSTYCGQYDPSEAYLIRVIAETLDELKQKAARPLVRDIHQLQDWDIWQGNMLFWNGQYYGPTQYDSTNDRYAVANTLIKVDAPTFIRDLKASSAYAAELLAMKAEQAQAEAELEQARAEAKEASEREQYELLKKKFEA